LAWCEDAEPRSSIERPDEVTFTGHASGGVLTLVRSSTRIAGSSVSIQTAPGEAAESVAQRLIAAILDAQAKSDRYGLLDAMTRSSGSSSNEPLVRAIGARMRLQGLYKVGWHVIAGTETGLGIPRPPTSVSGFYDVAHDQVVLRWVNPPGGYDSVAVLYEGDGYKEPGETNSYTFHNMAARLVHQSYHRDGLIGLGVVGYRGEVPSNLGAIHLTPTSQQEMNGVPFSSGIMPNWTAWSTSADANAASFEQGVKPGGLEQAIQVYRGKPGDGFFYQIIKTHGGEVQAGIWRQFLGLRPGHAYRVSARLNTLEMDRYLSEWSFSLHAAHNGPSGADLSVDQLSGRKALANGAMGQEAGRIVAYEPGRTTQGAWAMSSTATGELGAPSSDIVLPPAVTTLTVWVRHSGKDSSGVAIDWVKLEDLGPVAAEKPEGSQT